LKICRDYEAMSDNPRICKSTTKVSKFRAHLCGIFEISPQYLFLGSSRLLGSFCSQCASISHHCHDVP